MRTYYVYIMASRKRVLYIGMTNNIVGRVDEHRQLNPKSFTGRYLVTRLVHYETYNDVWQAINREKELKGWRREKKIALIESNNPRWNDLSASWYEH